MDYGRGFSFVRAIPDGISIQTARCGATLIAVAFPRARWHYYAYVCVVVPVINPDSLEMSEQFSPRSVPAIS